MLQRSFIDFFEEEGSLEAKLNRTANIAKVFFVEL